MARKPGSPRQQTQYRCTACAFTCKKHSTLILHSKEEHDIEL